MANVNAPFGFSPVGSLTGAPFTGRVRMYTVPASDGTALYIGSPVVDVGTSTTNADGTICKDVGLAATTDVLTGVVVAVVPDTAGSALYRVASTLRRLWVADDPNTLFEIQESTGGTAFTANDLGLNCSFAAGTPSTVTGLSGATADNSTEATSNTLALKLVGVSSRPNNAIGDSCVWVVRINRHRYADQLAGV